MAGQLCTILSLLCLLFAHFVPCSATSQEFALFQTALQQWQASPNTNTFIKLIQRYEVLRFDTLRPGWVEMARNYANQRGVNIEQLYQNYLQEQQTCPAPPPPAQSPPAPVAQPQNPQPAPPIAPTPPIPPPVIDPVPPAPTPPVIPEPVAQPPAIEPAPTVTPIAPVVAPTPPPAVQPIPPAPVTPPTINPAPPTPVTPPVVDHAPPTVEPIPPVIPTPTLPEPATPQPTDPPTVDPAPPAPEEPPGDGDPSEPEDEFCIGGFIESLFRNDDDPHGSIRFLRNHSPRAALGKIMISKKSSSTSDEVMELFYSVYLIYLP